MNKHIICLALSGIILTPITTQAAVDVYGRVHLSFGHVDETDNTPVGNSFKNWRLENRSSRVGFKGSQTMGKGLTATYKLEYEVNPDGENADPGGDTGSAGLKRRNQYLGIRGSFGELRFGRHDTPLKKAQGKFDQFNETTGDLKEGTTQDGETRADNMLSLWGKKNEIGYAIAVFPGEGDGTTGGDGIVDSISAGATYNKGPLYVALAHDIYDDTGSAAGSSNSLTRLVGVYKMGVMQFGLFYQTGVESVKPSDDETDTIGISFGMKMGKGKIKAQIVTAEDSAPQATENMLYAIGYEQQLTKTIRAYAMYSSGEEELKDNATTGADTETTHLGAGLEVKF